MFTTTTVVPGALEHRGARIQILDIPGLIAGAAMGKGRGKEVISVVRGADLIVLLVDPFNRSTWTCCCGSFTTPESVSTGTAGHHHQEDASGGIRVSAVGWLDLDEEEIRAILAEQKIMNAEVLIRGGATQDDHVAGNRLIGLIELIYVVGGRS